MLVQVRRESELAVLKSLHRMSLQMLIEQDLRLPLAQEQLYISKFLLHFYCC